MIGERITTGSPFEAMAGYSRAVVDGDLVYISGTTGYDSKKKCYPADVKDQAVLAFSIIEATLHEAGSKLENMIRIRVYVASREEFEEIKPIIKPSVKRPVLQIPLLYANWQRKICG